MPAVIYVNNPSSEDEKKYASTTRISSSHLPTPQGRGGDGYDGELRDPGTFNHPYLWGEVKDLLNS